MEVFLSHSTMDDSIASQLAGALQSRGVAVNNYPISIAPAENWDDEIQRKLEAAKVVVVLWTENSMQSREVRAEATYALNENKIFPIRVDGLKLWARYNIAQAEELNSRALDETLPAIVDLICVRLGLAEEKATTHSNGRLGAAGKRRLPSKDVLRKDILRDGPTKSPDDARETYDRPARAGKTIVFVAHATIDKPKLKPIVEALLDNDFKIWIDKPQNVGLSTKHRHMLQKSRIKFEGDWKEQINRAARSANRILACWSADAIHRGREQFQYEVYMGLISEKLVQCRIDAVDEKEIGYPYTFGQIADLSNFSRDSINLEFQYMMDDLASKKRKRFFTS